MRGLRPTPTHPRSFLPSHSPPSLMPSWRGPSWHGVAWHGCRRINKGMLDVAERVWQAGGGLGEMPRRITEEIAATRQPGASLGPVRDKQAP